MSNFLIVNKAKLPYGIIGKIIDDYINDYEDTTFYVGKLEILVIDYKDILYNVQIRYLKRYIEFSFNEMEEINDKKRNISKD